MTDESLVDGRLPPGTDESYISVVVDGLGSKSVRLFAVSLRQL